MSKLQIFCLLCLTFCQNARPDTSTTAPDPPGYVPPHPIARILAHPNAGPVAALFDNNHKTTWQSEAPLPQDYLGSPASNPFFQKSKDAATDGNKDTPTQLPANRAWTVRFARAVPLNRLTIKATHQQPITVAINAKETVVATAAPDASYRLRTLRLPDVQVRSLTLRSSGSVELFEVAGYRDAPPVNLTILMAHPHEVSTIYLDYPKQDFSEGGTVEVIHKDKIIGSGQLSGGGLDIVQLDRPVETERFDLRFRAPARDWAKISLAEIRIYDRYGPYGPPPPDRPNPVTLRDFLGVNAYWGWGHNQYAEFLPHGQAGPSVFAPLLQHARNYHDLSWDIDDPRIRPDFSNMSQRGTPAKEWLDWDREYRYWRRVGLMPHVSLQLHNLPHRRWTPEAAYTYGKTWAAHFAPLGIESVEIGNEPWAYPPETYRMVYENMLRGIRAAAPDLTVLPCALQATDPRADEGLFKNYIESHLPLEPHQTTSNDVKQHQTTALNTHAYSHTPDFFHRRRAVPPEDPTSTFNEVKNFLRWRDARMPGTPVWLTEFGYDYADALNDCTHPVCATETQARAWSQRTILLAMRWGVARGYWYFHADEDKPSALFTRSGLTKIVEGKNEQRAVYRALERLVAELGDYHFAEVIAERAEVYAYRFENGAGDAKYVLWQPGAEVHPAYFRFDAAAKRLTRCAACRPGEAGVYVVGAEPIFVQ